MTRSANQKRKKINFVTIAFCVVFALILALEKDIMRWAGEKDRQADVQLHGVVMERLANEGKRDAIIWIAQNIPEKDDGRLSVLASSGDGEALFLKARKTAKNDLNKAKKLLELSANAGYFPAVKYMANHLK